MSIVVAVRVGEGLVLAADSASTLMGRGSDGQTGVVKVFNHATKVLQLRDYPIGIASWGASQIGPRIIASLVEEYANSRPPLHEIAEEEASLAVQREAKGLMNFLGDYFDSLFPEWRQMDTTPPGLGVLVGGYSGDAFFPEEYVFSIPHREFNRLRPPRGDGAQDFGANWYGLTDAIVRLHFGRDERLLKVLSQLDVEQKKIEQVEKMVRDQFQYRVPFEGMPLQDAVDYAIYLVSMVVGRYRFVIGAELCGGAIDVATITRDGGFHWVRRKAITVRAIGPAPIEE